MKNTFLLLYSVFIVNVLPAQDIIIKHSGDTVLARITEITPEQIRYKRVDFPDGPDYLQLKSELAMIRYENGRMETFEKTTPTPAAYAEAPKTNHIDSFKAIYIQNGVRFSEDRVYFTLLKTKDPKIASLVARSKKCKNIQYVGFLAIPLGIAGIAACSSTRANAGFYMAGLLSIGSAITCPIVAGIFKQKRQQRLNEAINLYNENY